MNIGSLLPSHARYRPNHTAVVCADCQLNFREFNARVNRLANALSSLDVKKGDKVATILPNCLSLLETYWAVAKIGAVVVPLSPLLREKALAALIHDSDSGTVIASPDFAEPLAAIKHELRSVPDERFIIAGSSRVSGFQSYDALTNRASEAEPAQVEIVDDDPYNIIYSSGTTGTPKGIVHTHYIRAIYCTLFASTFRMTPESVVLHSGSIVFNGAFVTLMPAMYLGAKYVLLKSFDPRTFVETVERERATHIIMVPSQIVALLGSPHFSAEALKSFEMICSVGAPLHVEHKEKLNRSLPGRFYELYGLTEGFITVLDKNHYASKPTSVGPPQPFFEMRIMTEQGKDAAPREIGEIVGRGPALMPGYYKRPDLTAQAIVDGWLHTGDLGYVDEDGFLFLVDRKKDMIISGGVNVFPKDIEEIIVQHPAVRETAVFGVPDEKWGETPVAAVILDKTSTITAEELCSWINERVDARNQRVRAVVVMQDFPRSTAGKTLKRILREPYWAGRDEKM
ncbi:MAG TPA: AMP-binding protein [Terriglobales bacterium]|nr:AMP-binding protein [Terriglobales bacterium]